MELKLDYLSFPDRRGVMAFIDSIKSIIFPNFFSLYEGEEAEIEKSRYLFHKYISNEKDSEDIFYSKIPELKELFFKDLKFFKESDPACDSYEEIILSYPGYTAIFYYRIAHIINELGFKIRARLITEEAHKETGIDIHPGATIGSPFFIDHGTGTVIGETTVIGTHCKIYQGVTLGALSLGPGEKLKGIKRHPTIGDRVTIYSGASILGGEVKIGNDVRIGSNVFILGESIPDHSKVILPKPELLVIDKTPKK